jgi:hypothetical protein
MTNCISDVSIIPLLVNFAVDLMEEVIEDEEPPPRQNSGNGTKRKKTKP